ncbi:aromatic ring-hydroxylating oxygenase subunit alpha [Sphingomonas sp. SRS2]|uniref:aromatic ring-hydroxylating oxygenase subunit alpha n=1 Tax=Sphingomonas sp. SRS2 TaxID=133190 RepID=UPI000AD89A6C|nr:aromatic ring-hydroxylating dioxygenase subunit alpha [Sphingomonas sp. SRS2]
MMSAALEATDRASEKEIARNDYPAGFPALHPVPIGRYTDPAFLEAENRHLWKSSWLLAGTEGDIPESGSYILFENAGLSIIISRGDNGVIRAFHNICRHRAAALLEKPQGKAKRFVCPYHAWSYSHEGKLVSVPREHDFACIEKAKLGLIPVRCESWRGMIFINCDMDAAPLSELLAPIAKSTEGFPIETVVTRGHFRIEMDCNWKLAYQNFLEFYHAPAIHAQSLVPHFSLKSFHMSLLGNAHVSYAIKKKGGNSVYVGDAAFAPEGIDPVYYDYMISLGLFPNSFAALDPAGFALQSFWPLGVDRSVMEVRMLGWDTGKDEGNYWEAVRERFDVVVGEDTRYTRTLQRSCESGFATDLIMGYQERALYRFEEELDRQIGVENIPEHLRVTQVLRLAPRPGSGNAAIDHPAASIDGRPSSGGRASDRPPALISAPDEYLRAGAPTGRTRSFTDRVRSGPDGAS